MNTNILSIKRQNGVQFDVDAVAKELHKAEAELFEQNADEAPKDAPYKGEHIFNFVKGKLALYNGGYDSSWRLGNSVNIWGYSGKWMVKTFAKYMTAGEVVFIQNSEGSGVEVWKVTPGKVEEV
jgi:hypothetical protein